MSVAQSLWEENQHLVHKCLNHPFVQGMKDGSLDKEAFKRYVAQDAFFLKAFQEAYRKAKDKAPSPEIAKKIQAYIEGVDEELQLHADYSQVLGIDLENVQPMPECEHYTNFLKRVSTEGSIGEIIAAIAPCMTLYAYLGAELAREYNPTTTYKKWIMTYSDKEFQQLAWDVEQVLDAVAENTMKEKQAYTFAMSAEVEFFSGPLR